MKTAVVFYSLDGNCAIAAEEIKSQLGCDLIRLHPASEKNRRGISKIFWSFGLMFSRKNPPLKPYTFDASKYELIIIGAPVWGGMPASPVKTFISESGIQGKKIALFICHAGGMEKTFEKFRALLHGNDITGEIDFNKLKKNNNNETKEKIADWLKTIAK